MTNSVGVAIYSWDGGGVANALSFTVGERFFILSGTKNGWCRAARVSQPGKVGLVPGSLLVEGRRGGGEVAKEISQVRGGE